ncbi:hypothetical protein SISNIDRAFT_249165 [Sistotremastrum niveocremeum HHB9708]|uniref:MYND-type domain-containing protein n=1 Tax=Sistotremastrum niveocremeum HHB9708 TaxID=1314777 RepID=A0A164YVW6_9AGAM|nr:hypothetical protein SISNIDRAFT_249165 [Sistotremastrum niveocremeum HHB9708]
MSYVSVVCGCEEHSQSLRDAVERTKSDESYQFKFESFTCFHCRQNISRALICGGCKAVIYCGPECSRASWQLRAGPDGVKKGHKKDCARIKESRLRVARFTTLSDQFPWIVKMGDASYTSLSLATKGLVGCGPSFGWWADHNCIKSHMPSYLHRKTHYTEEQGWKLPDAEIPWLSFDETKGRNPPESLPAFEDSWKSYYEWRRLPMSSPAAFLLHWPLSLYRMLCELGFTPGTVERRKTINIHLIGPERELGFLPILGELALLFPHCDLCFTLFSETVVEIFENSPKDSLARQQFAYSYEAPATAGGGKITIALDKLDAIYDLQNYHDELPDAILAFHAGLANYETWYHVIVDAIRLNIPFAVTDYVDTSLDECDNTVNDLLPQGLSDLRPSQRKEIARFKKAMESPRRKRVLNSFMSPALSDPVSSYLPYALNAWIYIVHVKD